MGRNTVSRKITININGREIEDSLSGIGKEIGRIKKELRSTTDPTRRKKLNKELQVSRKRYKQINDELRKTQPLLSRIKKQIGPVGVALTAAFSVTALASWGQQLYQHIQLMRELKNETKQQTGLQGHLLDEAVSGTKAISDAFNTDYHDNLKAANTLSKQFNVSYQEALASIEKGYLAGANVSGDMLEQIKEYAPLMHEANIPLEEMVALIAQTEKEGIFNDKGIDAIKEGMLKIREGTKATREAIEGIGIDSTKMYDDIQDGTISYFEAMQQVSQKLSEVEEQSPQVGAAVADIFGGPGEDAGLQYLQSIKDINLELDSLIDTSDEYTRLKKEEIAINERLNDSWVSLTETGGFFNQIALVGKSILADILFGLQDIEKVLERNQQANVDQQRQADEEHFRAHMERMKKALGDRYDYEELRANYASNIHDETISNYILSLDELTDETVNKTDLRIHKIKQLEEEAAERRRKTELARIEREEKEKAEKILQEKQKLAELLKAFDEEQEIQKELEKFQKEQKAEEEEILRLELKYEKLNEQAHGEKELEKRLEEQKAIEIQNIRDKHAKIREDKQKKHNKKIQDQDKIFKAELAAAELNLQIAKEDALLAGVSILRSVAQEGTVVYKALFAAEKVVAAAQVILDGQRERAAYAANPFWSAMPDGGALIKAKHILASKIRTGISLASIAATAIKGFAQGGHTGPGLGYTDESGHDVAGVVHKNEYVVPAFIAQDPVYADTIGYLESKRVEGLSKGYVNGGSVTDPDTAPPEGNEMGIVMNKLLLLLSNGIMAHALIGDEEIAKHQARQNLLNATRESAKIQ